MIKEFFLKSFHHNRVLLKDGTYVISLIIGLIVFAAAFLMTYFVSDYKDAFTYASVGDFILDKIPTFNLEVLFIEGLYVIMIAFALYSVFIKPQIIPFALKCFAILLIVRSCFVVLMNVGPPAGFIYENVDFAGKNRFHEFIFRNDLFFSGHTSIPFLCFLLLKKSKVRWFFFVGSIVMGMTVLLMHVHYSIDVFAAFFITYGIYQMSDRIFNKLNIRFSRRIKLYGWAALQRRMKTLREKRKSAVPNMVSSLEKIKLSPKKYESSKN